MNGTKALVKNVCVVDKTRSLSLPSPTGGKLKSLYFSLAMNDIIHNYLPKFKYLIRFYAYLNFKENNLKDKFYNIQSFNDCVT